MKKLSYTLCVLVCSLSTLSAAHATDTVQTDKMQVLTDMDAVLDELSHNKISPPTLFKGSSEPLTLATNSSLMNINSLQTGVKSDDMLSHLTLVASNAVKLFKQTGRASWYGGKFHGRKTASGERFNMNAMTAAHKSLPFNTYLKVTNKTNGKSVVVKVNDRGPFGNNRILDLSYGAAKKIGLVKSGVANISIEKVPARVSL